MTSTDPESRLMSIAAPFVIGIQLSSILTGMNLVQAYNYYSTFLEDKKGIKFIVAVTVSLNLISNICDMAVIWRNSITVFGDYSGIRRDPPSRVISLYLGAIIALVVQTQFAYRSWRAVNFNRPILFVMVIFILSSLIGALAVATLQFSNHKDTVPRAWAVLLWLMSTICADVCITSILVYRLGRSKHGSDLPDRAQAVISKALRVVLTTGAGTSALAFVHAMLFVSMGNKNSVYMAAAVNLPRVYTISLLYSLNCRVNLRSDFNGVEWEGNEMVPPKKDHEVAPCDWSPQYEPHPTIPGKQIMVHQTTEIVITRNPEARASLVIEEAPDPLGYSTGRTTPVKDIISDDNDPRSMTSHDTLRIKGDSKSDTTKTQKTHKSHNLELRRSRRTGSD